MTIDILDRFAEMAETELGGKISERLKQDCRNSWVIIRELFDFADEEQAVILHHGAFFAGAAKAQREFVQ